MMWRKMQKIKMMKSKLMKIMGEEEVKKENSVLSLDSVLDIMI